jgi:hypothetical protein
MQVIIETPNLQALQKLFEEQIAILEDSPFSLELHEDNIAYGKNKSKLMTAVVFVVTATATGVIGNAAYDAIKLAAARVINSDVSPNLNLRVFLEKVDRDGTRTREELQYSGKGSDLQIDLPSGTKIRIRQ